MEVRPPSLADFLFCARMLAADTCFGELLAAAVYYWAKAWWRYLRTERQC
jgi:hypothetical protein